MKLLTCHAGALHVQQVAGDDPAYPAGGDAGADALWSPGESAGRAAVHELLFDHGMHHPPPVFPAAVLARGAMRAATAQTSTGLSARAVVWIDPAGTLYPPGVVAAGIPADRLYILRPGPADLVRAAVDCLRCDGVAAVVAVLPPRVSPAEVRRLQLAAERGRNVGVLLRATLRGGAAPDVYAAATRWLVAPAPGERTVQRWSVQLVHGHGRALTPTFLLEKRRDSPEANVVRPSTELADQPAAAGFPPAAAVRAAVGA